MTTHVKIIIRNSGDEKSFDKALSIFTKKVNKNRHLKLLKEKNRGYKKPSFVKHEKELALKHKREIDKRKQNRRRKY